MRSTCIESDVLPVLDVVVGHALSLRSLTVRLSSKLSRLRVTREPKLLADKSR
jgi:hypothetical protein